MTAHTKKTLKPPPPPDEAGGLPMLESAEVKDVAAVLKSKSTRGTKKTAADIAAATAKKNAAEKAKKKAEAEKKKQKKKNKVSRGPSFVDAVCRFLI